MDNEEIETLELETKRIRTIDPSSKVEVRTYNDDEDYTVHSETTKDIEEGEYIRVEKDAATGEDKIVPHSEIAIWSYNDESTGLNISTIGDKSGPPKEGSYVKVNYEDVVVIKEEDTLKAPEVQTTNANGVVAQQQPVPTGKTREQKRKEIQKKVKQAIAAIIIPIVIVTGAKACGPVKDIEPDTNTQIVSITDQDIYALIDEMDNSVSGIRDVVRNSEMQPAAIEDDQTLLGQPVTHTVQEGNQLIMEGNELANDYEGFVEKTSSDPQITYGEAVAYVDEGIQILDRVEDFYEYDRELMEIHAKTNKEIEEKGLRTEATHHEGENTEGQIALRTDQLEQIAQVKQTFIEAQQTLLDTDQKDFDAMTQSSTTTQTQVGQNVEQESDGKGAK